MPMTQKVCITDCDSDTGRGAGVDMDNGLRMVEARACGAWPLPGDATCAGLARRTFRRAAAALGLDPEVTDDGVTMVSELAANTLHAQREQRQQPGRGQRAAPPELWLYLRGTGPRRELVCKVFDAFRGWVRGNVPGRGPHRPAPDATSGRGLEVVHELSEGRWGYHPTRARLAGWGVGGKAVWFSVPAATESVRPAWMPASAAMTEFEDGLAARGFDGEMVRADDSAADIAVLSVRGGLTVWCWSGTAWLHAPGLVTDQWGYCDLVEVAEQAVEAYESLAARPASALLAGAGATRPGALPPG
jgi:hypothetical protein